MERAVRSQTGCCQPATPKVPWRPVTGHFGPGIFGLALAGVIACLVGLLAIELIFRSGSPWGRRMGYFGACAVLCVPLCMAHGVLTIQAAASRTLKQAMAWVAAGALWSGLPTTAAIYGVDRWFRPDLAGYRLWDLGAVVVAAMLLSGSVTHFANVRRLKHAAEDRPAAVRGRPATAGESAAWGQPTLDASVGEPGRKFLDRLPAEMGEDPIYLRMRDHYVEVFTTAGQCVLLMRFGDAVRELDTLGMRVHRSFWVNHAHVEGLVRRGQRRFLRLTGDREIPVSRSYRAAAEGALARRGRVQRSGPSGAADSPGAR